VKQLRISGNSISDVYGVVCDVLRISVFLVY